MGDMTITNGVLISMKTAIIILIVGVAIVFFAMNNKPSRPVSDLKQLVKAGAKLVDVRSPGEYAGGHIDGAINIPLDQVARRLADFGPKDQPIIVYCRSGARSGQAQKSLENAGFKEVYNLGSISNW